jgi:hypothetical protein
VIMDGSLVDEVFTVGCSSIWRWSHDDVFLILEVMMAGAWHVMERVRNLTLSKISAAVSLRPSSFRLSWKVVGLGSKGVLRYAGHSSGIARSTSLSCR